MRLRRAFLPYKSIVRWHMPRHAGIVQRIYLRGGRCVLANFSRRLILSREILCDGFDPERFAPVAAVASVISLAHARRIRR